MKLLADFLPIILFFATFKFAGADKDWAAQFATEHFGFLVSGGKVGPGEAPVLLATLVVIAATLAQVVYLKLRGKAVSITLWVTLGIVTVLGGATIWFHDETFIKWKFTVLYWIFGLALWLGPLLFGRNLIKAMMGSQIDLPDPVWNRLNLAWIAYFGVMGLVNLWVAYSFSTDTWVNFKLFGGMGGMLAFIVAQAFYMARFMPEDDAPASQESSR